MKTTKLFLFTVAVAAMSFNTPDATLTDAERKYAVNLMQETKDNLLQKVKGLNDKQLNFKPSADSWSVAECIEHITIAENDLFALAQSGLKGPADPSKRGEVKTKDEDLVKMVADRTDKRKTVETMQPTGKFGSVDATLAKFKAERDKNIQYIKTTKDDLRNHYNDFPFGKLDTYQTILLMTAHSKRHTAQIEEIITSVNFPK